MTTNEHKNDNEKNKYCLQIYDTMHSATSILFYVWLRFSIIDDGIEFSSVYVFFPIYYRQNDTIQPTHIVSRHIQLEMKMNDTKYIHRNSNRQYS